MSCVPGRHDWLHIPRALAQPAGSVLAVPRSLPKAQSGEMLILSVGSTVPQAYCITCRNNHGPREAESHMRMTDPEEQTREIRSLLVLWFISSFATL
jgi:hypothetical protein